MPCARLSWPFHQLLSARKYIVSYRIVSYRTRTALVLTQSSSSSSFIYIRQSPKNNKTKGKKTIDSALITNILAIVRQ